jgi:hypothetical protein
MKLPPPLALGAVEELSVGWPVFPRVVGLLEARATTAKANSAQHWVLFFFGQMDISAIS